MKISSDFINKKKIKERKKVESVKLIKIIKIRLRLKRTWEKQGKFVSAKYSTVLKIENKAVRRAFLRELRKTGTNTEAQI